MRRLVILMVAFVALIFLGSVFGPGTHFGALDGYTSGWNPYTLTCVLAWLAAIYQFMLMIQEATEY